MSRSKRDISKSPEAGSLSPLQNPDCGTRLWGFQSSQEPPSIDSTFSQGPCLALRRRFLQKPPVPDLEAALGPERAGVQPTRFPPPPPRWARPRPRPDCPLGSVYAHSARGGGLPPTSSCGQVCVPSRAGTGDHRRVSEPCAGGQLLGGAVTPSDSETELGLERQRRCLSARPWGPARSEPG